MKLYLLPGCPYCDMVTERLAELGLEYEAVRVAREREKRTEVQEISGQPTVPVMVDGERVLSDEEEILRYLEEEYC